MKKAILNFADTLLSKEQMKKVKGGYGYEGWTLVGTEPDPVYPGGYWCVYEVDTYDEDGFVSRRTEYLPSGACTQ